MFFIQLIQRSNGFGIRKYHLNRGHSGEIKKRIWVYDKEGFKSTIWLDKEIFKREPRPLTRERCHATFGVVRKNDNTK